MAEKEYIEREALVGHLENAKEILWHDISISSMYAAKLVDIYLDCIKVFPTVEAAPVRHGEWCGTVCSACGESTSFYYDCYYCPWCGAKMDGDPYA